VRAGSGKANCDAKRGARQAREFRSAALLRWANALCALSVACALVLTYSTLASAAEGPAGRVRIERPLVADALLDESVARTLGELSALGLEVEVLHRAGAVLAQRQLPALEGGLHGMIALYRFEGHVRVDVWAPSGGRALQLDIDPNERGLSAEVIAIRAVEALRSRWLEYEQATPTALPERVAEIARTPGTPTAAKPTTAKALPEQATPRVSADAGKANDSDANAVDGATADPTDSDVRNLPDAPHSALGLSKGLRAALGVGYASEALGTRHWIGAASAGWSWERTALGLAFDTSLTRFNLSQQAGSVDGSRSRLMLELESAAALSARWELLVKARLGVARYWLDASAAPGYVAHDRQSVDVVGAVSLGARYWLQENIGIYLDVDASALRQALAVDVAGEELGRLGLPGLELSSGLSFRYP
jgi:hypothetical protein